MIFHYKEMGNGFFIRLNYDKQKISSVVPKDVPKDKRIGLILNLIEANTAVTMEEMAKELSVSIKTIKRDIEKLKADNIIKRQSGRKTGYWEIIR